MSSESSGSWLWIVIIAAASFYWFGGESDLEKENKHLKNRVEELEADVDYIYDKLEKKKRYL